MKYHLLAIPLTLLLFCCAKSGDSTGGIDSTDWSELRQACLDFTNAKRATESKAELLLWEEASTCSDNQARMDMQADSPHGHFKACKEGAQNTCPGWSSGADIESQKQVLTSCLQMMWDEGPGEPFSEHGHYINMSSTSYSKLTCGFHYENGSLWINQNFR